MITHGHVPNNHCLVTAGSRQPLAVVREFQSPDFVRMFFEDSGRVRRELTGIALAILEERYMHIMGMEWTISSLFGFRLLEQNFEPPKWHHRLRRDMLCDKVT